MVKLSYIVIKSQEININNILKNELMFLSFYYCNELYL